MPTYDYECDACGHTFEIFQSINESLKRKCPECGKLRLRRLFGTGAAVVFKGSGFYQTDYRSDSYKKAAEADKKEASGKSDNKEKSSDNAKSAEKKSSSAKSDKKSSDKKSSD